MSIALLQPADTALFTGQNSLSIVVTDQSVQHEPKRKM